MRAVIDKMFGDLHIHMILDGVYYRAAIDAHRQQPVDDLLRVFRSQGMDNDRIFLSAE